MPSPVETFLAAIGYPERAPVGASSFTLLVDDGEVEVRAESGRLFFSRALTREAGALPRLAALAPGRMLREEGWERHARVCERHTGTGLTAWDIEQQQLPLPHEDFMPEVMEEQVVCYADKFYSKTRPGTERTVVEAMRALEKFGWDGIKRFQKWVDLFE